MLRLANISCISADQVAVSVVSRQAKCFRAATQDAASPHRFVLPFRKSWVWSQMEVQHAFITENGECVVFFSAVGVPKLLCHSAKIQGREALRGLGRPPVARHLSAGRKPAKIKHQVGIPVQPLPPQRLPTLPRSLPI